MFGLKKKPKQEAPQIQFPQETSDRIRTMPNRFYIEKGRRSGGNKLFVILAILLILAGIVLAGLGLTLKLRNEQSSTAQQPTPTPSSSPYQPVVPDQSAPQPTIPAEPTPIATVTPTPTPSETPLQTLDTTDSDGDGLTGQEEQLFSTNANSSDTDGDGYRDSDELLSGYNPRLASQALASADIVSAYSFNGLNLLYPAQWIPKEAGTLLILDSRVGDSVSFSYMTNTTFKDKQALVAWIQQNDPTQDVSDLIQTTLPGPYTVYTISAQTKYYVFSSDLSQVWIANYRLGAPGVAAFMTTFKMILNSFH